MQNQSSTQIDLNSCQIKLYRMSNAESECPWGLKAVKLLQERGLNFEDIKLRSREDVDELKAGSSVLSMLILTQTVYWQAIYREMGY